MASPGHAAGPVRPGPASGPVRARSDLGQAGTCSGPGQSLAMPGPSAIIGALPIILRKCHPWAPKIDKGGARVRVHLSFVRLCKVETGVKTTRPCYQWRRHGFSIAGDGRTASQGDPPPKTEKSSYFGHYFLASTEITFKNILFYFNIFLGPKAWGSTPRF